MAISSAPSVDPTMSPALPPANQAPESPRPPIGLRWRSSRWFIVSTVGMGIFSDMVLYCLIVPVLPFMLEDRIHVPDGQIQSQVSNMLAAYAAASVISSPIAGFLADRWGTRRSPFLLGLTALLLATIMLAFGQTLWALFVARALQGLSGAVVWVVGLALLIETVGSESLGAVIGSIYSLMTAAALLSPVLGGVLYKQTGYAGVFGVSIALVAVDFIMRLLVIEAKVAAKYDQTASKLHGDPSTLDGAADFQTNDTAETTPLLSRRPLPDPRYRLHSKPSTLVRRMPIWACMRHPRVLTAFLVAFVEAVLFGTFDSTIPVIAKENYGFDSMRAGLLFLALGFFDLFVGPLAGWAVDRFGPRLVAVAGYAWLTPVLCLFLLTRPGGEHEVAIFCVLLSLCGIGMATVNAPSLVEAGIVVEKYHAANPDLFGQRGPYAELYGLNSMVWNLGLAVGPLLAGCLKVSIGYGNMMAVMAALSGVTCALSFFYMGEKADVDEIAESDGYHAQ